jgi:hypothetical protein
MIGNVAGIFAGNDFKIRRIALRVKSQFSARAAIPHPAYQSPNGNL